MSPLALILPGHGVRPDHRAVFHAFAATLARLAAARAPRRRAG